jgi:hypothetical protein
MMASKAADKVVKSARAVRKTMTLSERMLWEKYNKPGRNLFQALGAFENNGVGQRVVRTHTPTILPPHVYLLHLLTRNSNQ